MFFKASKKKGMTLIEIIISLAILTVLIVPIANLIIKTSDTSRRAQDKQKASLMGQSILEQIGNMDPDDMKTTGVTVNYTDMTAISSSNPSANQAITITGINNETSIDCGNPRYTAKVSFSKKVDNTNIDGPALGADTGEKNGQGFESNYKDAAISLEIAKDSDASFCIYNPVEGTISPSCSPNDNYFMAIAEDGECNLYSSNASINDFKTETSAPICSLGHVQNNQGYIRIQVVGNDKLIINNSNIKDQYDKPFDFKTKMSFVSDYDSDFHVVITKGTNVTGNLNMKELQSRGKKAHTIDKMSYQSSTEMDNKIGDLYQVTIIVTDSKLKGSDKTIFESSTTCYINN